MKNISKNVSYLEATRSSTAERLKMKNEPNDKELAAMKFISENIFEKVRSHFNKPIKVTSFFRSPAINKKIPGASITSQHVKGEAMDIDADVLGGLSNSDVFNYIKDNLNFDQMIWEHGSAKNPDWVHVSIKECGVNRRQLLVAYKDKNSRGNLVTKYSRYE
jgi:hypothetical protein